MNSSSGRRLQTRASSGVVCATTLLTLLFFPKELLAGDPPPQPSASAAGAPEQSIPKAVADLQKSVAVNQEKTKTAQDKADDAGLDLNALKSGRLIQFGVTGGVAAALQFGVGTSSGTSQKTVALTPMPYVMALPGYWGMPQATRAYCGSNWGGGDESSASDAARSVAKKEAKRRYDAAVAALTAQHEVEKRDGAKITPDQKKEARYKIADDLLRTWQDLQGVAAKEDLLTRLNLVEKSMSSSAGSEAADQGDLREAALENISKAIWNPAKVGSCGSTKVGIWFGLPLQYKATTDLAEINATKESEQERDIFPKVAFGLAFVPNSYISFLTGLTLGTLRQKDIAATADTPAIPGIEKPFIAGTVAIGGNLDILTLLTK